MLRALLLLLILSFSSVGVVALPIKTQQKSTAIRKTYSKNSEISLNFQDISIRAALHIIARLSKMNIIINEHVKGHLSLHLENITWQKALATILKMQGLVQRKIDNIIIITPAAELLVQEKQQLQASQEMNKFLPLKNETFQIQYSNAKTYYDTLKIRIIPYYPQEVL